MYIVIVIVQATTSKAFQAFEAFKVIPAGDRQCFQLKIFENLFRALLHSWQP